MLKHRKVQQARWPWAPPSCAGKAQFRAPALAPSVQHAMCIDDCAWVALGKPLDDASEYVQARRADVPQCLAETSVHCIACLRLIVYNVHGCQPASTAWTRCITTTTTTTLTNLNFLKKRFESHHRPNIHALFSRAFTHAVHTGFGARWWAQAE